MGVLGSSPVKQARSRTCLWLPPFYASPLRDGGYDISDYKAVLPEFGTLPEFTELVSQAHARGINAPTRPGVGRQLIQFARQQA